jgi:hypothetical protein
MTNRDKRGRFVSKISGPNLFLWGIGGLVLSMIMVFGYPHDPKPIQVSVLATLDALSGAAIATAISGILKLQTKVLIAGGPFVVFILVFWSVMAAGAPGVLPDLNTLFRRARPSNKR